MQNVLKNIRTYLAGPIEFAPGDGIAWRDEFKMMVADRGIPIDITDPCDKGDEVQGEIGEEREKLRYLKRTGQYDEVRRIMKDVRR
jgi:hypothetical protein